MSVDNLYPIPVTIGYQFVNGTSPISHYRSLWDLRKPFTRLLSRITGERWRAEITSPARGRDESHGNDGTGAGGLSVSSTQSSSNRLHILARTSLSSDPMQTVGQIHFIVMSHSQSAMQRMAEHFHFRIPEMCDEITRLFVDSFKPQYEFVDAVHNPLTREIRVTVGAELTNSSDRGSDASQFRVLERESTEDSGDSHQSRGRVVPPPADGAEVVQPPDLLTPLNLPTSMMAHMGSDDSRGMGVTFQSPTAQLPQVRSPDPPPIPNSALTELFQGNKGIQENFTSGSSLSFPAHARDSLQVPEHSNPVTVSANTNYSSSSASLSPPTASPVNSQSVPAMSGQNGHDPNQYITYLFAACCLCGILFASTVSLIVVICCCTPKKRGRREVQMQQVFHKVPIHTEPTTNKSGEISSGSHGSMQMPMGGAMPAMSAMTGINTATTTTTQGLMQQLQSIQLLLQQQMVKEANAQQQSHFHTSMGRSFNGDSYQNSTANINLSRAASVGANHDVVPNMACMVRRGSDAEDASQSMNQINYRPIRLSADSPYGTQPIQNHVVLNPSSYGNRQSTSFISTHDQRPPDVMMSAPGSGQSSLGMHGPIRVNSTQFMEFLEFERRKASQQSNHSVNSHHSMRQGQDQRQYQAQHAVEQRNHKRKRSQSADQCTLSQFDLLSDSVYSMCFL